MLNTIHFQVSQDSKPGVLSGYEARVDAIIDGVSLIDRVSQCHLDWPQPIVSKNRYGGIPVWWFLSQRILERSRRGFGRRFRAPVLFCACGEDGCGDLLANISFGRAHVAWSGYSSWETRQVGCNYNKLNTFVFETDAYVAALRQAYDVLMGLRAPTSSPSQPPA
jgi:hypothetical protein